MRKSTLPYPLKFIPNGVDLVVPWLISSVLAKNLYNFDPQLETY